MLLLLLQLLNPSRVKTAIVAGLSHMWQPQYHFLLQNKFYIIAYDRQYKEIGDDEYRKWVAKLKAISKKYSPFCKISFLFDTDNLLGYKDAPIDVGKEVFLTLYKNRLNNEGKVS